MKNLIAVLALTLIGCGAPGETPPSAPVRCTFENGARSTVLCSCSWSCTIRADLLVDAELINDCGITVCYQDPPASKDAGVDGPTF